MYKKEYYFQSKGGAHIGLMLGLNAIVIVVFGEISYRLCSFTDGTKY